MNALVVFTGVTFRAVIILGSAADLACAVIASKSVAVSVIFALHEFNACVLRGACKP